MNLDAFNDVLRGGFGTPEGGFILRWKNHEASIERLGHQEAVSRLRQVLKTSDPSNIPRVKRQLVAAKKRQGPTMFDVLIEIIRDHGIRGQQERDGVQLELL